jgi:putative spermidine/putrescine transport system ATP-binding protein
MAADTKDAPAKAPKGFSLRSRLLGIPSEGTPGPASLTAALQPREAEAKPADVPEPVPAAPAKAAAAETPTKPATQDDDDEDNNQPRVGVALTPRRSSLLSSALGFGEKKPISKSEKAAFGADEQVSVVSGTVEPEAPSAPVEIVQETAPVQAEPAPQPRSILAAIRGSDSKPSPVTHVRASSSFEHIEEKVEAPAARASVNEAQEKTPAPVEAPSAQEAVPFVRFGGIKKTYDGVQLVVKDLNLDIAKGEFLTLLGPSGSGKTTTLMMLAGFEQPTSGDIFLNGHSLTTMPPHKRGLGFVFQNYALFPHMTVAENLAFPLEVRKIGRSEIKERVANALKMVELNGFEKRKPHQLSGGQQQRVAVARALVFDPELVLMDEPLGALDKHLREQMQYELKRLHRELGVTVVYVTHDQGEALTLSDRIAVFHDGQIQQLDTPTKIYDAPANAFVAGFIGENNALPGKIIAIGEKDCTVELIGGARVRAANGNCDAVGRSGVVCVRPEHLTVSAETAPGGNHVAALIEDFIFHGDHLRVKLSAPGMPEIVVKAPARGPRFPAKGVAVTLSWEPTAARAFVS